MEGIAWREKIRNEEIRARVGCRQEIKRRIMKLSLLYFANAIRMFAESNPKIALYGYVHGKMNKERPKKTCLDSLIIDCEDMGLNLYEATSKTMNRDG